MPKKSEATIEQSDVMRLIAEIMKDADRGDGDSSPTPELRIGKGVLKGIGKFLKALGKVLEGLGEILIMLGK